MEENQVEVEITASTVTTAQYGTLATGDKLRTSPEFARHLVKEAMAAKYTNEADDKDDPDDKAAENDGTRRMSAADEERNKRGGTSDPERQGSAAAKTTAGRGGKS